jgi:hypothetical protein
VADFDPSAVYQTHQDEQRQLEAGRRLAEEEAAKTLALRQGYEDLHALLPWPWHRRGTTLPADRERAAARELVRLARLRDELGAELPPDSEGKPGPWRVARHLQALGASGEKAVLKELRRLARQDEPTQAAVWDAMGEVSGQVVRVNHEEDKDCGSAKSDAAPDDGLQERSRRALGRFHDVLLDSNDLVAYRGQARAEFGSHRSLWEVFDFLIDEKARHEWEEVRKGRSAADRPWSVYSDINRIIRPLGLYVDAPRGKGAVLMELPAEATPTPKARPRKRGKK